MNAAVSFQKAERKQAKLRLAITGPSGSGKTFSALEIATGIGGEIAVIDTENGSASLYADRFGFMVMNLAPPFSPNRFTEAIRAAEDSGANVLIVDSMTHEWAAEGGVLDKKNRIDAMGGNSYMNWSKVNPDHEAFIQAILQSKLHIICTMRSKQDYVLEDRNGKQVPKKVGMAPVQRDNTEYEFTTVIDLAITHDATVSKDRTGLFDGQIFKPSRKTGQQLITWLNSGAAPKPTPPPPASAGSPPAGQAPSGESAAAPPSDDIAWPVNPENGDDGMKDEEWNAVVDEALNIKTKGQLQAWWKQVGEMFSKVWTEAQKSKLVAFKDELKARVG